MRRPSPQGPAGNRGIALVLVLWVITLLTVMAMGLTAAQRTESTLTANALDGARFRAAADAGIAYAVLNLLAPPPVELDTIQTDAQGRSALWLPDGSPHPWTFAETPLAISVHNEASRVDLNRADAPILTALLMILGVEEDAALALADRILDWRDPDDLTGLNGAEDPDYEAEGLPYGAKDGPFTSIEELRQVLGVSQDLYRRLAPEVTVDAGTAQVDGQFASAPVLAATLGVTMEEAQLAIAERNQPVLPGGVPGQGAAGQGRGGPLYRIRVARGGEPAAVDPGAGAAPGQGAQAASQVAMEALVRVEAGGQPPFQVIWRRYGMAAPTSPGGNAEDGDLRR
jgi:general secretion pathway protein K